MDREQQRVLRKAQALRQQVEQLVHELGDHFARTEARTTVGQYLQGLLSSVERKNSWQLAEQVGKTTPYAFQHLLGRAQWDEGAVRDGHVQRLARQLGNQGILAVDETGFLKKGTKSAGVARQYCGAAGKVDNCQIGVFLAWKTDKGCTLLDRQLYLPKGWLQDRVRCQAAGIPETVGFRTKQQLAQEMIARAWAQGFRPRWVVADEAYGHDYKFRAWLEEQEQPYVVAVPLTQSVSIGLSRLPIRDLLPQVRRWHKLNAGTGTKGPRVYEWAWLPLNHPSGPAWLRAALLRRRLTDPQEIAYYLVFARRGTSLEQGVQAAGSRWSIEECFEAAKGEVGLDQYEVRSYRGWYRHITLALLALALLVVTRAKLFPAPRKRGASSLAAFTKSRDLCG